MKKHVNFALATMIIGTMLFSTGSLAAADLGTRRINDPIRTGHPTRTNTTPTITPGTTTTPDTTTPGTITPGTTTPGTTMPGTTTPGTTAAPATTGTTHTFGIGNFNDDIANLVRNNVISQETADKMMNFLSKHQGVNAGNKKATDKKTGSVRFEQNADGSFVCSVSKENGETVYFEQKSDGSTAYYEKSMEKTAEKITGAHSRDLFADMFKQGILTEAELNAINNFSQVNR